MILKNTISLNLTWSLLTFILSRNRCVWKKEQDIIEKIDIGGISYKSCCKNFSDVLIVSSRSQYNNVLDYLSENSFSSDINFRKEWLSMHFQRYHYDSEIEEYFG